jgi:hypothetical protein
MLPVYSVTYLPGCSEPVPHNTALQTDERRASVVAD